MKGKILILVVVGLIVALGMGFFAGIKFEQYASLFTPPAKENVTVGAEKEVFMYLPAVDAEGRGVVADFTAKIRSGDGLILVSINDVIAGYETQLSARTAAEVAANFTALDLNSTDIVYRVRANASVIEGPSAGAAMAIATIFALENRSLPQDVMITGTIEKGGGIGQVGAIAQKAQAAKEHGARLFLVPKGLGTKITAYEKQQTCRYFDSFQICQTTYVPKTIDVSEELGIQVREVENVQEALKYFLGEAE